MESLRLDKFGWDKRLTLRHEYFFEGGGIGMIDKGGFSGSTEAVTAAVTAPEHRQ